MQMQDVLDSPITWILTGICIAGCIYAKRNIVVGIICGVIAPMFVVPVWITVGLAVNIPHLLIRTMFPKLLPFMENSPSAWAGAVIFLTDPGNVATFITAALFVWYCIVGRKNAHRSAAFVSSRNRPAGTSPFIRRF